MTTRITVTTGDGGLLERNAQQQAANRQGTLVKGQAEQAAATGAEQQRQRRIAAGLDPATGRPLPSAGSTSRLTRIDQDPAAFRGGFPHALLTGPFSYSSYGGSFSGLRVRTLNAPAAFASRYDFEAQKVYDEGVSVPGPTEATAALQPFPTEQPPPLLIPFRTFSSFDVLYGYDAVPTTSLPQTLATFAVQTQNYDTILKWQSGAFAFPSKPYQYLAQDQQLLPISARTTLGRIGAFTTEFILQVPDAYTEAVGTQSWVIGPAGTGISRSAGLTLSFAGLNITLTTQEVWQASGLTLPVLTLDPNNPDPQNPVGSGDATLHEKMADTRVVCAVGGFGFKNPTTEAALNFSQVIAGIEPLQWVHVAVVRYPSGSSHFWNLFVNGVKILQSFREPPAWIDNYGTQPIAARLFLTANRSATGPTDLNLSALHAARFTPKVLYADIFTPPTAITGFAS